jgi:hypothetical protein
MTADTPTILATSGGLRALAGRSGTGGRVGRVDLLARRRHHRYATDDGTGLLYRGTELIEAVTEVRGKSAYQVTLSDGEVRAERLETRMLPGSA